MKDLSIVQEYFLCSLNEKGKFPAIGREVPACILAGGLLELMIDGSIQQGDKKTVRVTGGLSGGKEYLRSLFDWLNQSKPVKLETVAQEYCFSFTEKKLNTLISDIGDVLVEKGCVSVEKGGFLAGKPRFLPDSIEVDRVIQKIRAEMLETGKMADETVALVSLLEKSQQIKRYFSKYESEQLKARLKEIRETPSNQLVKQLVDQVEAMLAALVAVFASV